MSNQGDSHDEKIDYGSAILAGFEYLLSQYPDVFVLGQGLWSPWYVGNSMTDLDKKFGIERIIDTPVSESGCTGVAIGASLCGTRPIVVHPRMDFMLYAIDAIVNQAAKWSHMFGGQAQAGVTIRAIINRGGEQGAQHSGALHSWFAHIPGLRVVMPSMVADARDLLIASVLCPDPVLYIDDRWLYQQEAVLPPIKEVDLRLVCPQILQVGSDMTIVAAGYSVMLAQQVAAALKQDNIDAEVIDLRVLNPFDADIIIDSVAKTGRLLAIDGGWESCGMAGEVIAKVSETLSPDIFKASPKRLTLPPAPAPSSPVLEKIYYPDLEAAILAAKSLLS